MSERPPEQKRRRMRAVVAVAVAAALGLAAFPIYTLASSPSSVRDGSGARDVTAQPGSREESNPRNAHGLVVNGGFEEGTAGWRTNDEAIELLSSAEGRTGLAAELSTTRPGPLTLNDDSNTVPEVEAGEKYTVTAWVRTTAPEVSGELRVREVGDSLIEAHKAAFTLAGTSWQQVTLDFSTAIAGASLDLNVHLRDMAPGTRLLVDDVSMVQLDTEEPSSASYAASTRGIPECAVLFGAAVGGNTDPEAFEQTVGGTLQIRRTFWGGKDVRPAVSVAEKDIAAGRLPWISFKLPYSWTDMASGAGDTWARNLADRLAQLDGPVWVAFHHEPEGDGSIDQWVAMQQRLSPIVRDNAPNVAYTTILTGWHQRYGDRNYSLEALWPGDGLVDVIGFDPYNWVHGEASPEADRAEENTAEADADFAETYYPRWSAFAENHGAAWGIAETGFTDEAFAMDPGWLERSYTQMVDYGGVAFTYFNTHLNSDGYSWEITSVEKHEAFARVLQRANSQKCG